ncbi:MAG TPA: ferritin-like domain-containing protein [Planctomycetaceae bacterium]|nr:ferritin-like domain-containing protein [Planctomycetaceae bacterium]
MSFFTSLEFNSLEDLFIEQIEDLYDAEQRIVQALPKMADAAHSPDLRSAFQTHLRETEGQVVRLERIFQKLGRSPERETCAAMKGLISEGEQMVGAKGDPYVKDAALIAAAQRIEHYEIAAYGTARTFARQLGREAIANELQETLDEEGNADKILTELAEALINVKAHHA